MFFYYKFNDKYILFFCSHPVCLFKFDAPLKNIKIAVPDRRGHLLSSAKYGPGRVVIRPGKKFFFLVH